MPAGGSTYVDIGGTNWGPPVATLQFAPDYFATSVIASQNSCSARIDPIAMYITNRGGTIPQLNTSEVIAASCILSTGLAVGNSRFGGPAISGVRTPAAAGSTSTGFLMNSEGVLDQYGVYWETMDSGAPAGWKYYTTATGIAATPVLLNQPFQILTASNNKIMAPLGIGNTSSITAAELTLPRMSRGTYKIEFDAYILNDTTPTTPAVLTNTFSVSKRVSTVFSPITDCHNYDVSASTSNSHNGEDYASITCSPAMAGVSVSTKGIGPRTASKSNYDGDAGGVDDSLFHIVISGYPVTPSSGPTDDIVIRFSTTTFSLGIDNVMISLQDNIVVEDDMEASVPTVYPSAFPTPVPSPSFNARWIANGIPTEKLTGIGWLAGRFGRTEDEDVSVQPSSDQIGYKNGSCATLHLPYLAAGDYGVTFDLYLFDSWDGAHAASPGASDQFLIKIEGDTSLRFRHYFSNLEGDPDSYQSYLSSSTCNRFDVDDTNEDYCQNCARSCDRYDVTDVTKWGAPHARAYAYSDFAHNGSWKDSYYGMYVPFTQKTDGNFIMHFCGAMKDSAGNLKLDNESFGLKDVKIVGRGAENVGINYYTSAFDQTTSGWSVSLLQFLSNGWALAGTTATIGVFPPASSSPSSPPNFPAEGNTYRTCSRTGSFPSYHWSCSTFKFSSANLFKVNAPMKSADSGSWGLNLEKNYSTSSNYPVTSDSIPQQMKTDRFKKATTTMMGPFNQAARLLYPGLDVQGLEEGDYLVDFDVWSFDSWDGVAGSAVFNGDLIKVLINGNLMYSGGLYSNAVGLGGEMLAGMPMLFGNAPNINFAMADWASFGTPTDRKFHGRASFHQSAPARIGDRARPVRIEWKDAALQSSLADESWGLDNVVIRKTSGAPTVSCGIQYRFTDSNNNAADYCLRFKQVTYCASGNCGCTAQPMNDIRGAFTVMNASQNHCP